MNDALAVGFGTLGALAFVWLGIEVQSYRRARRSHGPNAPGRGRLRAAVYVGAAAAGGVLGLVWGALLRG
jgi:hypothetical protein